MTDIYKVDERGASINGLTFTGVNLNGRLLIISDQMPLKTKTGEWMHLCHLPDEKDPLTGEVLSTIVCSKQFFDDLMSEAEVEKNKVESLSQR